MTKRRVETDLDDLSEDLLGELTPDERLQLAFTAGAARNEGRFHRLLETCPRHRYWLPDRRYTMRVQLAFTLAQRAVYDLHTTLLLFGWIASRNRRTMVATHRTDLEPEELGVGDESPWGLGDLLRELYANYYGYKRFADEELGVPLARWLSAHPRGPTVARRVAEVLADHEGLLRVVEDDPLTEAAESDDRVPADELADARYRSVTAVWTSVVGR